MQTPLRAFRRPEGWTGRFRYHVFGYLPFRERHWRSGHPFCSRKKFHKGLQVSACLGKHVHFTFYGDGLSKAS